MKMNKKTITILSFTLGALVFMATAFADIAAGSGYDKLKASMKRTTGEMEKNLKNYTTEVLTTVKDNGTELIQSSNFKKVDNEKEASETSTVTKYSNGKTTTHYNYTDKKVNIWKSENEVEQDKYYVTEYVNNTDRSIRGLFSDNPFNRKGVDEIEKIVDAVVGNLKNSVQAEERPEGGLEYSGSLSEAQVPALVNAVSSFFFKQNVSGNRMNDETSLPEIESDIFIKNIAGKAVENKSGLLESLLAEATLSGKDKNGTVHELTMSMVMKISDIGNTTVSRPDLSGKKIEKVSRYGGFDSKYVGKYKNDIVIEKDGNFVKIGERVLEITHADDKNVAGRYFETYKPGFEEYFESKYKYDFTFEMAQGNQQNSFTYTNPSGQQEMGQIHSGGNGKLYLNLNIEIVDKNSIRQKGTGLVYKFFDGQFSRVFDE